MQADSSWKSRAAIDLFNDLAISGVLWFPVFKDGLESFCRWHLTDMHTTDQCDMFRSFLIKQVYYENLALTEQQLFAMRLEDFLISNGKRLLKFLNNWADLNLVIWLTKIIKFWAGDEWKNSSVSITVVLMRMAA